MTTLTYAEWQRVRRCTRKVRHDNLLDARWAVLKLWQEGKDGHAYQCEHCSGWHTTSDPAPLDPEVIARAS